MGEDSRDLSKVTVATCPSCHHEVSVEDFTTDLQKLTFAAGALIVHATAQELLLLDPRYEAAVEGYNDRVREMLQTMSGWVHDLQDWGEHYDEV